MHAMTRIKTGGWPATAMITGLVILFSLVFADSSVRADTIIDNGGAGTSSTGSWGVSGAPNPYGADALWSRDGETYTWRFTPSVSGSYDVSMWWTQWPSRSSSIPVEITSASGTARVIIDQLKNGGIWNRLGTYYFTAGITYAVTIISQPGPTSTCADAVKFTLLNGNYPPDGTIEAPVGDVTIPQGGVVNFSGSGTDPEGAAPLACLWHFGNGSGIADSTVCTPGVVRFDLPGSFVVTFTVSDPSGLPDPTPDQRVITVLSPGDGLYMPDWTSVSESPFAFAEPAGIINPVLTAADVTDAVCDFVADPFMFHADGTWYLFFEAHNIIRQAGEIGLATSADGLHWTYDRIVLSNPWHNSYPLVFGYDGKYYMVPESGSEQAVYLYEASNFPYNWKKVATLISGKAYVDSTIFRYNDAWWLFTTVDNDSPDSNREARLFYSDSLLSGWTEHPKSPFITYDRGTARPGGRTFVYDGRIIRVAQKCDVKYGEKVRAFQVDLLTKTDYAEHEIPESPILSSSGTGWNAGGMHQFDPWWAGDHWLIAVDGNHSLLNTDEWSIGIYTTQNTAPSITSEPVTAGVPGGTYAYDVNASGKPAPLYGLVEPVPEGMTIDPATGLIHWVPQSTGDYAVTVRATNSVGSDTQSFVITVSAYTVIDNGDGRTSFTGDWALSSAPNPYEGASLWSRDNTTFTWNFTPSASGMYDVSMWWTEWSSRSAAIPVDIQYAGGTARVTINQLQNGGKWNLLGTYTFNAGTTYKVTVTSQPGPSSTCADAVKFTAVAGGNMPPVAVIDSISPASPSAGEAVTFAGHGTDSDGTIAAYEWSSSLEGSLGNSASLTATLLHAGTHTISFRVQDDKGSWSAAATRALTVSAPAGEVIVDNLSGATSRTGVWENSSATGFYASDSVWSRDGATFTWNFTPSASGMYDVSMWWTEWSSRSAAIPVDIQYAGGTARVTINQLQNGGKWNLLGTYTFNAGTTYKVTVTSQPGPSSTCADAVKFTPVAGGNMPPVAVIDSILPNPAAAGHAVTFTGHGTDADGGIAGYLWKSNIDGTLSTLPSFSSSTLSVGSHIVAFVVRDDKGADSLPMSWTLTVKEDSNVPPVATIDSITPNPSLPDQTVTFIGHGSDDDGTITEWSWRSSRDGVLGSSASFSTAALTSGIHTIYFKVRDNKGAWSPETPAIISRFGCGAPVKIMPLGDSITHGYDATIGEDQEGLTQGYRGVLFGYLQSAGYSVDFVGSLEAGFSVQPLFDTDHEGHDGFSAEGGPYGDILSNVQGYLSANPADVILLHIGTNDISFGNQDPSEVEAILDEIERCRPNTLVFLARIINRTDGAGLRSSTTAFNDAVEAMALERIKRGDPLVMVNLESALDYLDDMSDALHPNSDGYAKMAAVWRDAVTPYLPACGGGATSVGATFSGRAVLIQDWMKTAPYLNYPGMNRNAARTLLSGLRN